jgi:hypothetical protein
VLATRIWHADSVSSSHNAIQGDFGETWLKVVASGCGLLHGSATTVDLDKADVQLTLRGYVDGTYSPTIMAQVKTEIDLRTDADGNFVYNLDVQTYDVLRRDDHSVRRVLVVIGLAREGAKVRLHEEGTLLVGRGAWVSLERYPPTGNTTSQVIKLPAANTLDEPGLYRMLRTYGVRRSSPVPDVDTWDDPKRNMEGEQ